MFTGIISSTAKIVKKSGNGKGLTLEIAKPKAWKIKKGDSININGVCSTVVSTSSLLQFQLMPETLTKTNLASLIKGETVNLEQSLRLGDRLDGHMVSGHVDTTGTIVSIKSQGNSKIFAIKVSGKEFAGLLASKGSVTVEGISLTVVLAQKNNFSVHIIPYTISHTNLHSKRVGDTVNIEFDTIAKYLKTLLKK